MAEENAPCDHRIIKKAQTEGLNSLSLVEIPQFWVAAVRCKQEAKKAGKKINFRHLYRQKQEENFEKAREISGVGTFCLVVTGLVLFYSYFWLVAGSD
ncbi:MAG: hypothetical protein V3U24_04020 [Candidatus Neomarinimicrobiota bacterium]